MANRITHTNNSNGHDGTYVYRSTSPMDPQALPAPIADEAPVAQGATFEYIDNESLADGTYYYRTQDHEGGQVSTVSGEVSIQIGEDYSSAQIGDEIGGGIYAGVVTDPDDGSQWHLVAGKQASEAAGTWGYNGVTGTSGEDYDGKANTDAVIALGDFGQMKYCNDYTGGGFADWYMPARLEFSLIYDLANSGHPEFQTNKTAARWTSTESSGTVAQVRYLSTSSGGTLSKANSSGIARPVRRVTI